MKVVLFQPVPRSAADGANASRASRCASRQPCEGERCLSKTPTPRPSPSLPLWGYGTTVDKSRPVGSSPHPIDSPDLSPGWVDTLSRYHSKSPWRYFIPEQTHGCQGGRRP